MIDFAVLVKKSEYVRSLTFQGGPSESELLHVVKERDELKAALLDFEKHMEDIQNNVKVLSTERDHFKTLFKQVGVTCSCTCFTS